MKITVEQVINLLDNVSTRGFLSPEVPYSWSTASWCKNGPVMHQQVNFTDEEKNIVRQFMAENVSILRSVDYPRHDMLNPEARTINLLGMISHMLHNKDCGPEYVADNAKRLQDIQERFNTISANDLKSLLGE